MKKIFLISLSMILGIALVGCGKTNSDNNIVISDEVSSDTVSSNGNEIDTQTKNCIELSKIALPDIATESDFMS